MSLSNLGVRFIRLMLLAGLTLFSAASGAAAAGAATQVGQFDDKSGSIFGFFTTEQPRVATIVIQGPKPTEDSDKPIMVFFIDKTEWAKFVALWRKAEKSPAKTQAKDLRIGDYFDASNSSMLSLSVDYQHIVQFIIIDQKVINTFTLTPADFAAFDADVKKITAYLGN
jgi:hypothetical protein